MSSSIDHKGPMAADIELQEVSESKVPAKWRGTEKDALEMKVLGRTQETRRIFNFISMLGFGSTLMVTWVRVLYSEDFACTY